MVTARLLWLLSSIFLLVASVLYFELPYGFLLSSLLSFSKFEGSFSASGSSDGSLSFGSQWLGSNSTNMNSVNEILNITKASDGTNLNSGHVLDLNASSHGNEMNRGAQDSTRIYGNASDLTLDKTFVTNLAPSLTENEKNSSSIATPQNAIASSSNSTFSGEYHEYIAANHGTRITSANPNVSSLGRDGANVLLKSENSAGRGKLSSSITRYLAKKRRVKGQPAVVVPISAMKDLLFQSPVSYHSKKPRWPSQADKELLKAKELIQNAEFVSADHGIDVKVYRNFSTFVRSYELMVQTLKIFIYSEGERPIFHQPELEGIYASEGWFMKQLEENKHFVTKNSDQAHLFYFPFSSWILKTSLYVANSHTRQNMVQYLSQYLQKITTRYRFWNRTGGADHFLVACHDWAPAETSLIMKSCIRALCNADVERGFQFSKDVSLPETNVRQSQNPLKDLGGKPPSQRRILAFFAGRMHGYLRPILLREWGNKDPDIKIFGKIQNRKGESYAKYMKSSKYCISAKGYEAYTPRVVEAIFYECVPVIISDNYIPPFFESLNWESFAVFILEKDIPNLKNILLSIPEKRYFRMQQRVKQVQKHFLWHKAPVKYDVFHMILHSIWYTRVFQMLPGE